LGCGDHPYEKFDSTPKYITSPSSADSAYYAAYNKTMNLWNINYQDLYIPTTFGTAHVVVCGPEDGEPLVLLHGMNASSTMWYPNAEALSKNHQVFAIDFILEPGKSRLTKEMENVNDATMWYNEVISALQLKKYHLIGASRGGWFAVKLALNQGKKVKSLILLSPAQTFTWIKPSSGMLKSLMALLPSQEDQMAKSMEGLSSKSEDVNQTYLEQYQLGLEQDSKYKFLLDMQPFSEKELEKLTIPVLVLVGDRDIINGKKTVYLANKLPKGKGIMIKNAGHFLSVDQADKVNEQMIQFLN
jgi:pimeloyl-ACP methyl ester carboxylesterase